MDIPGAVFGGLDSAVSAFMAYEEYKRNKRLERITIKSWYIVKANYKSYDEMFWRLALVSEKIDCQIYIARAKPELVPAPLVPFTSELKFLNHFCVPPAGPDSNRIQHILCEAHHMALGQDDNSVETVAFMTSYIIYLLNCDSVLVSEFWDFEDTFTRGRVRTKSVVLVLPSASVASETAPRNTSAGFLPPVPPGQDGRSLAVVQSARHLVPAVNGLISLLLIAESDCMIPLERIPPPAVIVDQIKVSAKGCVHVAKLLAVEATAAAAIAATRYAVDGGSAALEADDAAKATRASAHVVLHSLIQVVLAADILPTDDFVVQAQKVVSAASSAAADASAVQHNAAVAAFAMAATTTTSAVWRSNYYAFADDNTVCARARAVGRLLKTTGADGLLDANHH